MVNSYAKPSPAHALTIKIVIGMVLGIAIGLLIKFLPLSLHWRDLLVNDLLSTGGQIFLNLIKMLVVPIVFVSLVCGSSSLGGLQQLGRVGIRTLFFYLVTTAVAITIALLLAKLFHVGAGMNLGLARNFSAASVPTIKDIIVNLFPSNPIAALMQGNMLQIIVFALLVGIAMAAVGKKAEHLVVVFKNLEAVLIRLVLMIMQLAPYGVFCLLATQFSRVGLSLIGHLLGYFLVVVLVLLIQLFGCYSLLLGLFGRLNPKIFFRKMYQTMLFAFSVSSSSASIPLVLNTVKQRLGVQGSIASFIVPLGATINMDGTAIMQGVATVFIAHAYHVSIGLVGYLTVIGMATLASIGTAGVPGVGMITLAMVLQQVGLPVEGIGLIIGIDRLLDMARTAVNISGDAMIACLVGKSEVKVDMTIYRDPTK